MSTRQFLAILLSVMTISAVCWGGILVEMKKADVERQKQLQLTLDNQTLILSAAQDARHATELALRNNQNQARQTKRMEQWLVLNDKQNRAVIQMGHIVIRMDRQAARERKKGRQILVDVRDELRRLEGR